MKDCQDHDFERILAEEGIRITAVRLLVMRTLFTRMVGAFSLQDVVDELVTADSSSVFRTLTLFAEHKILHLIDDGSGVQKYCICRCTDHEHHHGHIHFTCIRCKRTFCISEVPIPTVSLPNGFDVEEAEYVIKGVCPECGQK